MNARTRIALYCRIGPFLRQSLLHGIMKGLTNRPEVELVQVSGRLFLSWEDIFATMPDGVVATVMDKDDVKNLKKWKRPVVNCTEVIKAPGTHSVISDNRECGRIAGDHLSSMGLTHYGFIGELHKINSHKRQMGFHEAVGVENTVHTLDILVSPHYHWNECFQRTLKWVEKLPLPIGVYASSEIFARLVINAAQSLNLNVPQQLAVVGTGNYDLDTVMVRPHLSSVPMNWTMKGYLVAQSILNLIDGKQVPLTQLVQPSPIVVRGSSDYFYSADKHVEKALHFIRSNYHQELQIEDVCRVCSLSRRAIEKRFRSTMGTPIYTFINAVRLREAQRLLIDTNATIESIAQECGFKEARILISVMKKANGMTPGAYRKQFAV